MKGTVLDLIIMMVVLVALSITLIFAYLILDEMQNTIEADTYLNETINVTFLEQGKAGLQVYDTGYLFLLVVMGLASIIGAFMIRTHPILFMASFLLLAFILYLTPIIVNLWYDISTTPELLAVSNQFPTIATVILNFPTIILVLGIAIMIALYGGFRTGGSKSSI